jgi:NADH:ubiquinone oxidoreductase subunit K
MDPVQLVFLILAAVLFGLAAFGVVASRISLGWAGALCFTLSVLLPALLH